MLGLILFGIIICLLYSILQELKSIKEILIKENGQERHDLSIQEKNYIEVNDVCPACGEKLNLDSTSCPNCGLNFKED